MVALRQGPRWARPFSLPAGRSVLAILPQPASGRVQVQYLASAPLRQFANSVQSSSFSVSEFESSRRSEIGPEDSLKSPPVLAPGAHWRSKHQCTQRKLSRCGQAWRKCPLRLRNVNLRVRDELLGSAGASPAVSRASRDTLCEAFRRGRRKRAGVGARAPPRAA